MLLPFSKEIDHAFRQDRNLPRKLLGAVVVGLSFGLGSIAHPGASPLFYACATAATVLVCVVGVLALSLRDVVRRRMSEGESVNPLLRLYLASGKLSLALWAGTAIVASLLLSALWPA